MFPQDELVNMSFWASTLSFENAYTLRFSETHSLTAGATSSKILSKSCYAYFIYMHL